MSPKFRRESILNSLLIKGFIREIISVPKEINQLCFNFTWPENDYFKHNSTNILFYREVDSSLYYSVKSDESHYWKFKIETNQPIEDKINFTLSIELKFERGNSPFGFIGRGFTLKKKVCIIKMIVDMNKKSIYWYRDQSKKPHCINIFRTQDIVEYYTAEVMINYSPYPIKITLLDDSSNIFC